MVGVMMIMVIMMGGEVRDSFAFQSRHMTTTTTTTTTFFINSPTNHHQSKYISRQRLPLDEWILSSSAYSSPPGENYFMTARSDPDKVKVTKTIAIVGGGPSGLLLACHLLESNHRTRKMMAPSTINVEWCVRVYESRERPELNQFKLGKAYALGVGRRGRTALKSISAVLRDTNPQQEPTNIPPTKNIPSATVWDAVQRVGFGSERFQLHAGPFTIRLRDSQPGQEPSLLLFQSDLCAALVQVLEDMGECLTKPLPEGQQDHQQPKSPLQIQFNTKVTNINLEDRTMQLSMPDGTVSNETFDLIVGCDGVNSVVRQAIQETWEDFESTKTSLPGLFKTCNLPVMPPKLDPTSVALLLPKKGTTTAFVEPTAQEGRGCCILFAGSNATDPILTSPDETEVFQALMERYPLLRENDNTDQQEDTLLRIAANQLAQTTKPSQAASVKCNTYHFGSVAALCGDAAHATGGVSGQGVNSALVDSIVLGDMLNKYGTSGNGDRAALQRALLEYSKKQVPEGWALYDLSFPPSPTTGLERMKVLFTDAIDTLLQGKFGIGRPPLPVILTTTLESFADIRRQRQGRYGSTLFPDESFWNERLESLDAKTRTVTSRSPIALKSNI